MKSRDLFHEVGSALSSNKARSGLTILGIVIGTASVIAMVAIGQGAQNTIQSSIQSLGSNLIIVVPGTLRGPGFQVSQGRGSARSLKQADADAIARDVPLAAAVSPELSGRYQIASRGKNTNTQVLGVSPAYAAVRNLTVASGNFITDAHLRSASKVAVLGPTARDDLFGVATDPLGEKIRIRQLEFTIVGIAAAKGGSGFSNPDDQIYIPITAAQRYLAGDDIITSVSVQARDAESMSEMQGAITTVLLDRHHITDPSLADFSTVNQADIVATASSVTQTFTLLLGAVAGISLLVGGIGIMNMMLTTVTERTREIGLRKAIGARRRDIVAQFLSEAVALTVAGGAAGIALGWTISFAFSRLGFLQTRVTLGSVALAFGVAALIGIIFGYYPAHRAARLNPIEALRYE